MWMRFLCCACVLCVIRKCAVRTHVSETRITPFMPPADCEAPSVYIAVLTMDRVISLKRLLLSLANSKFDCVHVDLSIYIDMLPAEPCHFPDAVRLATTFKWPHGEKHIILHAEHVGLAGNWFSVGSGDLAYDFIAIFEDDMELRPLFYSFIATLNEQNFLDKQSVTGVCLHPSDWEVDVQIDCSVPNTFQLYESPEPCNWGPIWKSESWAVYMKWVHGMKQNESLPHVPEEISYNYNAYLNKRMDVQSPWVWRYHWETGKRIVRYSLAKCRDKVDEKYFAVNHKEPGKHFTKKPKRRKFAKTVPLVSHHDFVKIELALHHTQYPQYFRGYLMHESSLIPAP